MHASLFFTVQQTYEHLASMILVRQQPIIISTPVHYFFVEDSQQNYYVQYYCVEVTTTD
jgi:hypothetical protein